MKPPRQKNKYAAVNHFITLVTQLVSDFFAVCNPVTWFAQVTEPRSSICAPMKGKNFFCKGILCVVNLFYSRIGFS